VNEQLGEIVGDFMLPLPTQRGQEGVAHLWRMTPKLTGWFTCGALPVVQYQLRRHITKQICRQAKRAQLFELADFLQHRLDFYCASAILDSSEVGANGEQWNLVRIGVVLWCFGLYECVESRAGDWRKLCGRLRHKSFFTFRDSRAQQTAPPFRWGRLDVL
jgi:hypothetical protein